MTRKLLPAALAILAFQGAAAAQDIDCLTATSGVETKHCAGLAAGEADAELNSAYRDARSAARTFDRERPAPASAAKQLVAAQRAWIRYRDEACGLATLPHASTTGFGETLQNCLERLTRARTTELVRFIEDAR